MDKEQAYKIGLAFKLGIIYARGKSHARQLANDDAKWITVHPNGKANKGRPALLDSETGEILGGMGGKFNGKHISAVPQHGKNEQMGAQMRANTKNHKADLKNGQKIGFIKNPNTQKNLEETKKAAEQRKNNQTSTFSDRAKEALSRTNDFSNIDDRSVSSLPYEMLHEKVLQVGKESRELGNFENQLRKEKEESAKTQNRVDTDQEHRDYNGALNALSDRQKKLGDYSRVLSQELRKRENNKTDNENLSDKSKKFYENQLNNKQTNTNSISVNDLSNPQKVSDYNKNVTKIVNKHLKAGGGLDQGDFTNIVNSMTDDEDVKKNALSGINTSINNDYWAKYPQDISLKHYEARGFDFSVPELGIKVWTKPQDLTSEQRKGMQEYLYKEYTKEKIRRLKLGKEDVKRLSPSTQNKALNAAKDNGSVASVLNVPDASKWNNKIYSYRNREKAVFINNQKIVLNDEQYKKLKELAGK